MMKRGDQTVNDGDAVYCSDSKQVGSIEYCEKDYCKIDTGTLGLDYYVPSSAIEDIRPGEVFLNVASDTMGQMGWERPPNRTAAGVRRQVVREQETDKLGRTPEEEIGESEPM